MEYASAIILLWRKIISLLNGHPVIGLVSELVSDLPVNHPSVLSAIRGFDGVQIGDVIDEIDTTTFK